MKLGTKLFFATVTMAVAGWAIYRVLHGPGHLRAPKFLRNDEGVRKIHEPDKAVSAELLARVHPEIDTDALSSHRVGLTDKAQMQAYDISERLWTETDFEGKKDDLVRRVLESIAPQTSWHIPRSDLKSDDARAKVWDGVAWIVELMGASAEEQAREFEKKTAEA